MTKVNRRGPIKLAARQQTTEDANGTAQKQDAYGHQEQGLAHDSSADVTDKIEDLRADGCAFRHQIRHGVSGSLQNHSF